MALRVVAQLGAMPDRRSGQPGLVRSAERAVRIIEILAASPTRLTVAEIHARVGIKRARLLALLRTLSALGWIEVDESGSNFGVGPHALLAGIGYLDKDPVLPYAYESLAALRDEIGHTVHFARLDGDHVLYLASSEARGDVRVRSLVGRRLPAHLTAIGQVLLAELSPDEIDKLLPDPLSGPAFDTGDGRRPTADLTRRDVLHEELARVRARSWALEREQGVPGVACVASVVGYRVPATDAISCSMPAEVATDDELTGVIEAVVRHARRLAGTLRREGLPPARAEL
jgi:DNA-binding IclR family transcriptional regulator